MNKNEQHSNPLNTLNKNTSFEVPKGYFGEFPKKLQSELSKENQVGFGVAKIISIAAAACLVLSIFLWNSQNKTHQTEALSAAEIEQYLLYEAATDIDDEALAIYYNEKNETALEIVDDDITNYLLNEDVNVSDIYY